MIDHHKPLPPSLQRYLESQEGIDHKQFVADFITEMNEQDNRCTASPFYYQIRTTVFIPSYHEDEYDRLIAIKDGEEVGVGSDINNLCEKLITDEEILTADLVDDDNQELDDHDIKSMLEKKGIDIYQQQKSCEYKGVFFTESDAKAHLIANHYHYSSDADTYVNHAWRAPQLEQFFKSVGELCGVEFQRK